MRVETGGECACVETWYACAWKPVASVRVWKLGMRASEWRPVGERVCVETWYECAWKLVVSVRVWKIGVRACVPATGDECGSRSGRSRTQVDVTSPYRAQASLLTLLQRTTDFASPGLCEKRFFFGQASCINAVQNLIFDSRR